MSSIIVVSFFVGFFSATIVHGYSRECDFNQTIFAPVGTTATFQVNVTDIRFISYRMRKTSGSTRRTIVYIHIFDEHEIDYFFGDHTWEARTNISSQLYSDDILNVRIDLSNLSMNDNGTYTLGYHDTVCFILYVIEIKTEPSSTREENEPILVYAHPHASLIKRPLTNATMTWLLDGKTVNQTAGFVQQDGQIMISNVGRGLNEKNVTYRAVHDDGSIIEVNVTLKVKYGPSLPLILVPRKSYYNLVIGEILPNITCTSECYPPCDFSWGELSRGNILSLGPVTTEDTGEYICTATRADGQAKEQKISLYLAVRQSHNLVLVPRKTHYNLVTGDTMPDIKCTAECYPPCYISWDKQSEGNTLSIGSVTTDIAGEYTCIATRSDGQNVTQSISIYVTDNSYFNTAIACLATLQALTIIVLGLLTFFIFKRKMPSCCHQQNDSKKNKSCAVTFSVSTIQGSENENYEELTVETKNKHNTYSEVNLALTDDEAKPSHNKYENTTFSKKNKNVMK